MTGPLTLEDWRAVDGPFDDPDTWYAELTPGSCTACGQDAWAGRTGWWHEKQRLCPARKTLTPQFAADTD